MVYGTPFEKLEDDEKSAISKRPKGVQDEIVTDERGRRRFHGAFTGGFSAGYFNTAGSKHGWVPQTFKSSRDDRAEKTKQAAEDFMDEEDLGEFGIAARKLRPKVDFMDSLMATPGEKHLLAWERSSTTLSLSAGPGQLAEDGCLVGKLTDMLRPVNESVGVRLLKKMGWRPGKGIGMKMNRRELERQKVNDSKNAGRSGEFDEEAVKEVEAYVQGPVEFSPDDVAMTELTPKEDVHGLGYKPLQESSVLSQKYGTMESALKMNKKSKGIRGQAFGVGAFEEDDEDIYTNFDLTQYDFEVGASSSTVQQDVPKFDSTFVPASTSAKRNTSQKFFVAPQPPPGWRPHLHHTKNAQKKDSLKLPENVVKATDRLTPFQRAKLLGERDHSVIELLSSADRERLKLFSDKERKERERQSTGRRQNESFELFEEEPMKAHRFKQYVNYLKRGIHFPQPIDMTRLEWEHELSQFQNALTPELRSLLPEVRDRQKPLAKIDFAQPIAEHLNSRFAKETGASEDIKHPVVKDERVEAVHQKQFGQATRQKYEWHPARDLCKRFNVPNPYPDSQLVGSPGLSRRAQRDYSSQYSLMDLGGLRDTAAELAAQRRHHHHTSRFDQKGAVVENEVKKEPTDRQQETMGQKETTSEEAIVPMELLSAIFGDDEGEESHSSQGEEEAEEEEPIIKLPMARRAPDAIERREHQEASRKEVLTVLDLVEDDGVYGPTMPPCELLEADGRKVNMKEGAEEAVITVEESEEDWKEAKNGHTKKAMKKKKMKKERSKKKEAKKRKSKKKEKRRKRRRHSSSAEECSSTDTSSD